MPHTWGLKDMVTGTLKRFTDLPHTWGLKDLEFYLKWLKKKKPANFSRNESLSRFLNNYNSLEMFWCQIL